MSGSKADLVKYRLERAKETFEDAQILRDKERWNSIINRLYYSLFYAISALLLNSDYNPTTHAGTKSNFSEYFKKMARLIKNTVSFIHNCLHGDKKVIMQTYLILIDIKLNLIFNQRKT